jgi:hypothetical protein
MVVLLYNVAVPVSKGRFNWYRTILSTALDLVAVTFMILVSFSLTLCPALVLISCAGAVTCTVPVSGLRTSSVLKPCLGAVTSSILLTVLRLGLIAGSILLLVFRLIACACTILGLSLVLIAAAVLGLCLILVLGLVAGTVLGLCLVCSTILYLFAVRPLILILILLGCVAITFTRNCRGQAHDEYSENN